MAYQRYYSTKKSLVKDPHHKVVSGVCAGIANYYQFPKFAVRIAAVLALLTFPVATGVAYVVANLLLDSKY